MRPAARHGGLWLIYRSGVGFLSFLAAAQGCLAVNLGGQASFASALTLLLGGRLSGTVVAGEHLLPFVDVVSGQQ